MTDFFQTLLNAVAIGSFYALIALGYTMVYGILKFINFAHSDVVMLGAWIAFTLAGALGMARAEPGWFAGPAILLAAMVACGVLGFFIERLAYRPLRLAPRLNVLITAIGVSLLLQNLGQLPWIFGTQPQSMPRLLPPIPDLHLGPIPVPPVDLIGFGTAILLMFALERLVYHTRLGRAMRACAHDPRIAALMGIPVDRVIAFTFVLGSALAAAGGVLYAIKYANLRQPADTTWVLLGLKAFVAAVVGGIGNVRGAMLGGFLIAFVELFGARYLSPDLRDVYVFALLILILLLRPGGLLGSAVVEKV